MSHAKIEPVTSATEVPATLRCTPSGMWMRTVRPR